MAINNYIAFVVLGNRKMPLLLLLYIILYSSHASSQNLVPNPGFEITDCLTSGQQYLITSPDWYSTNGTTVDSYHTCKTLSWVHVPDNQQGHQEPASGEGYAGIRTYLNWPNHENYREYLGVKLTQPLIAGQYYYVGFKYNVGDKADLITDDLGLYLSASAIPNDSVLNFTPQISNPQGRILNNRKEWQTIQGYYLAAGGEQWLVIGNFFDDINTTIQIDNSVSPAGTTYFYIDDVVVSLCEDSPLQVDLGADTVLCQESTLILEAPVQGVMVQWNGSAGGQTYTVSQSGTYKVTVNTPCGSVEDSIQVYVRECRNIILPNVITPNGDGINDYFEVHTFLSGDLSLNIYNRWGTMVYFSGSYHDDWNALDQNSGVYYYRILRREDQKAVTGFIQVIK